MISKGLLTGGESKVETWGFRHKKKKFLSKILKSIIVMAISWQVQ